MSITFEPLNKLHFSLLLKWLEAPHVKKWWDQDITYTMDLVREKYGSYIKSYKQVNGINKLMNAYIIQVEQASIGYIQIYNAYDFPRDNPLFGLPQNLGAFDIFIGEEKYLGQNLGSKIISRLLNLYGDDYSHIFVDPDPGNIAAIKCYEKAGFKRLEEQKYLSEVWMLRNNLLEELKAREPIFYHPEKYGKTEQDIEAQMCDEFWEVGASGKVYTRQDVIEILLERYNDPNYQDVWETSGFDLKEIAPDNYLLTYSLVQDKTRRTRRATIWRKCEGMWKILYHQGTIISGS